MILPWPRAVILALAVAVAAGAGPVRAEEPLPARNRALLLLRVLVYDRSLPARAHGEARVALVFRPGDSASERDREAMAAALAALREEVVVAGRSVAAVEVPFAGGAALSAWLVEARPAAVYLCEGLHAAAGEITAATRAARVLSAAGSRALAEAGVAIALVNRGRRAGVVVNLAAAREEGLDLDAALLSLAEVLPAGPRAPPGLVAPAPR